MACAAPPQPALVDKEHSRSAIWKYFGYEANEHAKPKDDKQANMQELLQSSANKRR